MAHELALDDVIHLIVLRRAVGTGELSHQRDPAAEVGDGHTRVAPHKGESRLFGFLGARLVEDDGTVRAGAGIARDHDLDGGDLFGFFTESGEVEGVGIDEVPEPVARSVSPTDRERIAACHEGRGAARGRLDLEPEVLRIAALDDPPFLYTDHPFGGEALLRHMGDGGAVGVRARDGGDGEACAEATAAIGVADSREVGPSDRALPDYRVARGDEVHLFGEVEIVLLRDGRAVLAEDLNDLVHIQPVEGVEGERGAVPIRLEVVKPCGVIPAEVDGVVGGSLRVLIFKGDALHSAALDIDGQGDGARDGALCAVCGRVVLDADGGTFETAVVVVADGGVIPGELLAREGVARAVDEDVVAARALREDVGVADSVIAPARELGIARDVCSFGDRGVVVRRGAQHEHGVDIDRDVAHAVSDGLGHGLGVGIVVGRGLDDDFLGVVELGEERAVGGALAVEDGHGLLLIAVLGLGVHIVVGREGDDALLRAAEVAVGYRGIEVVAVDADCHEVDRDGTAQRRALAALVAELVSEAELGGAVCGLGDDEPRDGECVRLDLAALREGDVDEDIALFIRLEGVGVCKPVRVVDGDLGGQSGVGGISHFHHLTGTVVAAHGVGEASCGAREGELIALRLGEPYLGALDGARVDDDGDDRRIDIALVVLHGDDIFGIARAREGEDGVIREGVAPARDGDGLLILTDHDLYLRAREPVAREVVAEGGVLKRIDGERAIACADYLVHLTCLFGVVEGGESLLDIRVVREGDQDFRLRAHALRGDGEGGDIRRAVGVEDESVPIKRRLAGLARAAVQDGAALGHRAVELLRRAYRVGLHPAAEDGGAVIREEIGVRTRRDGRLLRSDVPLEFPILAYRDGEGDSLSHGGVALARYLGGYHGVMLLRRGNDPRFARLGIGVAYRDVVNHAVHQRELAEGGGLILPPDVESADIHRHGHSDLLADVVDEGVFERREVPSHYLPVAEGVVVVRSAVAIHEVPADGTEVFEVALDEPSERVEVDELGRVDRSREIFPIEEVKTPAV